MVVIEENMEEEPFDPCANDPGTGAPGPPAPTVIEYGVPDVTEKFEPVKKPPAPPPPPSPPSCPPPPPPPPATTK